ncbi:MAG: glycosyltransferase family 39 protein, partial [Pseudomonadota bacterium]
WLQAGTASLFGGVDAPIWAYRLPSAFAAWLTAMFVLWGARPLIGARGALLAAAMMATTLLLVAEGHIAKTDAALTATAAAAFGALAHIFHGQGGRGSALIFWLAIAVSILLKGPIVPFVALFALIALAWRRETRAHLGQLRLLPGLLLTVVLVSPWLIAIWDISGGAFFDEALGKDMGAKLTSGQENHWGPPGLFLALVWATAWPWAALLPSAAGWLWSQRRAGWLIFLAAWVIPFWVILEVVPTKLPHYVLPLYPALLVALAAWLVSDNAAGQWPRRFAAGLTVLPVLAGAAALIVLPLLLDRQYAAASGDASAPGQLSLPGIALAMIALALSVVAARAVLAGQPLAHVGLGVAAAALLYAAILNFALPKMWVAFPSPRMAEMFVQYQPCASGPAFSQGYHEPSQVFLTETGIRHAEGGGVSAALASDPGALVLLEDRWAEILGDSLPAAVEREVIHYFNYNRGKMMTARLLTPDDPRWDACLSPPAG